MKAASNINGRLTKSDRIVLAWLFVWLVINILQAAFTGLSNDEAYYTLYAENLAWGYFDHPPVTAILVWLGMLFSSGNLGVRLFFTLLQPIYLWILWILVRADKKESRTPQDAKLFMMLSATVLMLQLYGFIAVPDGPLMISSACYLLAFDRFSKGRHWAWIGLGAAMAFMAYSKYHGALVVLFSLITAPWMLKKPKFYLAGILALILFIPHLKWQYDHNWASFAYHLSGRNTTFEFGDVITYIVNMLVVFNPLFVPVFFQAWRKTKPTNETQKFLRWLPVLFIGFFLLSSIRGYVQPQWVIACTFGILYVMFEYCRIHTRTYRYIMRAGTVIIVLLVLFRIEMAFNPLGIKYEIFNNEESYSELSRMAAGRPLIFSSSYSESAKYRYYTGGDAYCEPNIRYRTHQWQFVDYDTEFAGQRVLIETNESVATDYIELANGNDYYWTECDDFRPVRLIDIKFTGIPSKLECGQKLSIDMTVTNPYSYAVSTGPDTRLIMIWKWGRYDMLEYDTDIELTLQPGESVDRTFVFTVPDELAGRKYSAGFAFKSGVCAYWFNCNPVKTIVKK